MLCTVFFVLLNRFNLIDSVVEGVKKFYTFSRPSSLKE